MSEMVHVTAGDRQNLPTAGDRQNLPTAGDRQNLPTAGDRQNLLHVIEAPGRVVRMPDGKRLPEGGALVAPSVFVLRCLADGDLEVMARERAE
jgi:hypothetical protein